MDAVLHFDDIPTRSMRGDDDDSVTDVTIYASSPSRRSSLGESAPLLWSTPLSGISGLTGGMGLTSVYLMFCVKV